MVHHNICGSRKEEEEERKIRTDNVNIYVNIAYERMIGLVPANISIIKLTTYKERLLKKFREEYQTLKIDFKNSSEEDNRKCKEWFMENMKKFEEMFVPISNGLKS